MGFLDSMLDRDEDAIHVQRAAAKLVIVLTWVALGLLVVGTVAAGVLTLSGVANVGSPWDRLFPLVILMLVLQLAVTERYRRKKLEERVKVLEDRAS